MTASAAAETPDLMLVDIGMDGYEAARRLRLDPSLRGIPLVALTGYGGGEDRRRALAAGFDHHLVKPVDPEHLDRLVARIGLEGRSR